MISIDLHREGKFHWDESDRHTDVIKEALDVIRPFIDRVDLEGDRLEGFAADLIQACGLVAKARVIDASGQLESELEGLLTSAAALGLEGEGVRGWRSEMLDHLEKRRPFGRVSSDAINLATSHSAKGLEWPVVIPLGLWRKISNYNASGFMIVPDASGERRVYFDGASLPADTRLSRERERVRELVRLLYVTLTRARRVLLLPKEISGTDFPEVSFSHLWSGLLEALPAASAISFEAMCVLPPPVTKLVIQTPEVDSLIAAWRRGGS